MLFKYWDGDNWQPGLDKWQDIGEGLHFDGPVTASSWGPGRYDVWALDDSQKLYHRYYQWPDGWSEWRDLGGNRLTGQVKVAHQRPGAVDLIALASTEDSGAVYATKSYDGTRWLPSDDGWYVDATAMQSAPAILSWSNTTVAYFGIPKGTNALTFRYWWGAGWFPEDGSWARLADIEAAYDGASLKEAMEHAMGQAESHRTVDVEPQVLRAQELKV